jgi:hypothetical protein
MRSGRFEVSESKKRTFIDGHGVRQLSTDFQLSPLCRREGIIGEW